MARRQYSKTDRAAFARVRLSERAYMRTLVKLARQIGDLVGGYASTEEEWTQESADEVSGLLHNYSRFIEPWARAAARRFIAETARRDTAAWERHADQMGRAMATTLWSTPIGATTQQLIDDQVGLITSLPRDAATRIQRLTAQATLVEGSRGQDVVKAIMETGQVSRSRAELIARTEAGRASTTLTQARAMSIGSPGYVWRTSGDGRVRLLHQKLNGQTFNWTDPPVSGDKGERSHPGCIYNCRCYPEVIIPEGF